MGAACLLREADLTPQLLVKNIEHCLTNEGVRKRMELLVKNFADADANRRIYEEILALVKTKK